MKYNNLIKCLVGSLALLTGCHSLDLNPLDHASSENWFSDEVQIEMSVNRLLSKEMWPLEDGQEANLSDWSDDRVFRQNLTPFTDGTLNSQSVDVSKFWNTNYQKIALANQVILKHKRALKNGADEAKITRFVAEARFARACAYGELILKYGDVPFIDSELTIDEAMTHGRNSKESIKNFIYEELDAVSELLPPSMKGNQRVTKGAALGMKARYALNFYDYEIAASAAKAVMDSKVYSLNKRYEDLFLSGKHFSEEIFSFPRAVEFGTGKHMKTYIPRNLGGSAAPYPTWDLLAAYTCTDGLPIDESPMFDPHDPFKNRDPRLAQTIVPLGSIHLGVEYNPHPQALEVMDYNTDKMIKNNDCRAVSQYASYNGLLWKKYIDQDIVERIYDSTADIILLRYADILLMYAEAKIELNQIDQSVLDAMNEVRARAYGVDKSQVDSYPAFTTTDQQKLRTQLRMERRVELCNEGHRYRDLIRWKLMKQVMSKKNYMMLYPSSLLIEKVVNTGDWFWPFAPEIDENGLADFTKMEATGKIGVLSERKWDDREYLWPIPEKEILINPNMKQNPGY